MFATLRHRNFAFVWAAGFVALLSDWAFFTVLPLVVFQTTGSPFLSALALAATAVPSILLGPLAGVLVDRWSRPKVMFWSAVLQGVTMLVFAQLIKPDRLWLGFAVVLVLSTLTTFSSPAESALLPSLVDADELVTANALNALNDNLARIIGPVVGTLLFARFGFEAIGYYAAAGFAVAAFLISQLLRHAPNQQRGPASLDEAIDSAAAATEGVWQQLQAGMQLVLGHPLLWATLLVVGLMALADGPASAILVPFTERTLGVGAEGFGLLLSARGVSGVIGSLAIAQFGRRLRPDHMLSYSLLLVGVGILTAAVAQSFLVTVIVLLVLGPAVAAVQTGAMTLLQQGAPDELRGRVFALLGAVTGLLSLFAMVLGGALGERWAPPLVFALSGVIYLIAGATSILVLGRQASAAPAPVAEPPPPA